MTMQIDRRANISPAGAVRRPDRAELYRNRARIADSLVAACWASAAAAVALFLSAGGAAQFSSLAATVTGLGIIAGLVGTDLVLVMLVLAARIPLIDRAVGHDRAMALHRSMGKPALYLLLAHAGLLLVGYAMAEGINPVAEIASLWSIPDIPLAFAGLGLLVLVVVSSVVAARRRFAYEFWYAIHLLSYAAVLSALPHQLSVGGMLAQGTFQRGYWIALYVIAIGSIVAFRIITPILRSLRHGMRVSGVEPLGPGVFSIHFEGHALRSLRPRGGQFLVWRFWTGSTWWHSHPISLSAVPTDRTARITIRELGHGTARLSMLPVGTRVSIEGPYGLFTDAARTSPKLAIVAAGIGITPVLALLAHSNLQPGEATVLVRGSTSDELYLWDELRALAAATGTRLYSSIGHRGTGASAWMSATDDASGVTLRSVFPDLDDSDLYICGPLQWTDAVESDARAVRLSPHQIHSERFDW